MVSKPTPKWRPMQLDVVARRLRRREEHPVRHQHRGREVVGEPGADQRPAPPGSGSSPPPPAGRSRPCIRTARAGWRAGRRAGPGRALPPAAARGRRRRRRGAARGGPRRPRRRGAGRAGSRSRSAMRPIGSDSSSGDRLGGGVELREVVVVGDEVVPHLLVGRRRPHLGVAADPGGERVGPLVRLAGPAVQLEDGLGHPRHVAGELAHLGQRRRRTLLGERGAQLGDEPRLVVLGEELHVEPEDRVELQQHRDGQRPLVLLDLVEVARAEVERPGECRLRQPALLAQAAQADAHERLLHRITLRKVRKLCR